MASKVNQGEERAVAQYLAIDWIVKKSCRVDRKQQLEKKGAEAEVAVSRNDTKALYQIVKDLAGTRSNLILSKKDKQGKCYQNQRYRVPDA